MLLRFLGLAAHSSIELVASGSGCKFLSGKLVDAKEASIIFFLLLGMRNNRIAGLFGGCYYWYHLPRSSSNIRYEALRFCGSRDIHSNVLGSCVKHR